MVHIYDCLISHYLALDFLARNIRELYLTFIARQMCTQLNIVLAITSANLVLAGLERR